MCLGTMNKRNSDGQRQVPSLFLSANLLPTLVKASKGQAGPLEILEGE